MISTFDIESIITIQLEGGGVLEGLISIPEHPKGAIILSQLSSNYLHNEKVMSILYQNSLAVVSVDLLTVEEFQEFEKRYDVELLSNRLRQVLSWLVENHPAVAGNIGLLASGKGAAAALTIAAGLNERIKAIVCRSGRPDLVYDILDKVEAPTLFVVGKLDPEVEEYNHQGCRKMKTKVKFVQIDGASHLLSEPGKLDEFTYQMIGWFKSELGILKSEEVV